MATGHFCRSSFWVNNSRSASFSIRLVVRFIDRQTREVGWGVGIDSERKYEVSGQRIDSLSLTEHLGPSSPEPNGMREVFTSILVILNYVSFL